LPGTRQEIREIRFNRAVDHVDEVSAMTKDAVRLMHEQERKETDDRCAPRFRIKALRTNFGPVIDMSTTGLRVLARRAPRANRLAVKLKSPDGTVIALDCQVVWVRRIGFLKHVLGLCILDDDAELHERLIEVYRACLRHNGS
jgi:hypothetical protein